MEKPEGNYDFSNVQNNDGSIQIKATAMYSNEMSL